MSTYTKEGALKDLEKLGKGYTVRIENDRWQPCHLRIRERMVKERNHVRAAYLAVRRGQDIAQVMSILEGQLTGIEANYAARMKDAANDEQGPYWTLDSEGCIATVSSIS